MDSAVIDENDPGSHSGSITSVIAEEERILFVLILERIAGAQFGRSGLASMIADEILKKVEFDAIYLVYNKFQSVVSFLPTVATILSPEILSKTGSEGESELDAYEIEGAETQAEVLQNLSDFQFTSGFRNGYFLSSRITSTTSSFVELLGTVRSQVGASMNQISGLEAPKQSRRPLRKDQSSQIQMTRYNHMFRNFWYNARKFSGIAPDILIWQKKLETAHMENMTLLKDSLRTKDEHLRAVEEYSRATGELWAKLTEENWRATAEHSRATAELLARNSSLTDETLSLKLIHQKFAGEILASRQSLNIRGALELAAEQLLVSGEFPGVRGRALILGSLTKNVNWRKKAEDLAENKARMSDVERCQVNLYHSFSKDKPRNSGVDLSVITSVPERVAVEATLLVTNIPFKTSWD